MEVEEVPVTDRVDEMSLENGTAFNVRVLKVSDLHQADLFVRLEQVKSPDIPQGDVSLSPLNSLQTSFRLYGFDYSSGTISVTLHPVMSVVDLTTPSTDGMKLGCQVLSNYAKVLLLDGRHILKGVRQLHVEGEVR